MAELDAAIATNKRDFEARYDRARQLFALQEHTAAMDELLEILMRDKAWSDGRARKTYVAILRGDRLGRRGDTGLPAFTGLGRGCPWERTRGG